MSDLQRQLAMERTAYQVAIKEARRLNDENIDLKSTIKQLRKALCRLIDAIEGDRMKNATQAAKDLL